MICLSQSHSFFLLPGSTVLLYSLKIFTHRTFLCSLPAKNLSQHSCPEHIHILSHMFFLLQVFKKYLSVFFCHHTFIQNYYLKVSQIQKFFLGPVINFFNLMKVFTCKSQYRNRIFLRLRLSGGYIHIRHGILQHKTFFRNTRAQCQWIHPFFRFHCRTRFL